LRRHRSDSQVGRVAEQSTQGQGMPMRGSQHNASKEERLNMIRSGHDGVGGRGRLRTIGTV
jgi:hypothetical protein